MINLLMIIDWFFSFNPFCLVKKQQEKSVSVTVKLLHSLYFPYLHVSPE